MSSKKHKLSSKRSRASEETTHDYDHEKFVNESGAEKFGLISKNRSFIKEKGFHYPDDLFCKTIVNKGWRVIFQPLRPTTTRVLRKSRIPHTKKGLGAWGVGKLMCEVYQSIL